MLKRVLLGLWVALAVAAPVSAQGVTQGTIPWKVSFDGVAQPVSQSGTWSQRVLDGIGNALASATSDPVGTEQALIVRNIPSGTQDSFVTNDVTSPVGVQLTSAGEFVGVLNGDPASTEWGVVVRNIPSGTQAISAAALPLPTGAATEYTLDKLTTYLTIPANHDPADFFGAPAVQAFSNSTRPVYTNGRINPVAMTDRGELYTSNNLALVAGSAVATGSGTAAGSLRVELPTNGTGVIATVGAVTAITNALPAGTNAIGKLAANSGVDIGDVDVTSLPSVTIGTFPDNEPFNVAQMNGVTVSMGVGASGTGTQRVAGLIHDGTDTALVTTAGALNADVSSIAGTTTATSNGGVSAGVQRVTIANDSTGVLANVATIGTSVTPGTAAGNLGKAEDATAASGDTGVAMLAQRKDTNSTLTSADAEYVVPAADNYGVLSTSGRHPNAIRCTVTVSTATTIQALGGSCATPGAGLSLYITGISFSVSAAGIAADAFPTLKYGTGGTCGSGTTVFWGKLAAAAVTGQDNFSTPIKIPANNEICWITTTAGSKFWVITGFIAP